MKKVRLALAATALCTLALATTPAGANCASGPSGGEIVQEVPVTGSVLYRTAADGAGVMGGVGYLEGYAGAEGARVHGSTADGSVNGDAWASTGGVAGVCVNDTDVV